MKTKSSVFNKKLRFLSFFYGLTMYFIQKCCFFCFFFYNMRDLLTVRQVNLLALRLSSSSHEERFHVGYIAILFCFYFFNLYLRFNKNSWTINCQSVFFVTEFYIGLKRESFLTHSQMALV